MSRSRTSTGHHSARDPRQGEIRYAHVVNVYRRPLGDALRQACSAGTFLLPVEDAGDFRVGQVVRVGDDKQDYTIKEASCAREIISIEPALAHPADDGDPVRVWDTKHDLPSGVTKAKVKTVDGEEEEPITVDVSSTASDRLSEGERNKKGTGNDQPEGEPVRLIRDGDGWLLFDASGGPLLDPPVIVPFGVSGAAGTDPSPPYRIMATGQQITGACAAATSGAGDIDILVNGTVATTVTVGGPIVVAEVDLKLGDLVTVKAKAGVTAVDLTVQIVLSMTA